MSIKHYFANMRIAEKFDSGKSADIWQNVRQNPKKKLHGIFLIF